MLCAVRESVIRGIGSVLASLHNAGVVHGDPTTSNLMVTTLPRSSEGTEAAAAGGPSLDPFQIVSSY